MCVVGSNLLNPGTEMTVTIRLCTIEATFGQP